MKSLEHIQFIILNAGIAKHYSDWNYRNVTSPFARIYMVIEGTATVHLAQGSNRLKPGYLYLIPPFTMHSYECDGYFSLYYFHVYESLTTHKRVLEEYRFPFEVEANSLDCMLIARLLEISPNRELQRYDPSSYDNNSMLLSHIRKNQDMPYGTSMETNGILNLLISRFMSLPSKKQDVADSRINRAIGYIRKNIDSDITLEDLASLTYMSKDYFIRLFKKEIGITPLQHINLKKIEKTQLLLISTDMSIKSIAQLLSFNSQANFNKLFKQFTGKTPAQYRESALK